MIKTIVITILISALLSMVSLTGCTVTETRTNTFTVGQNPSIGITVGNGSLNLIAGSDGEINITAKLNNVDKIDYKISQEGDTITVDAKTRNGSRAEITITTPKNTLFSLNTGNGCVNVTDVQASGQITCGNGFVVLKKVKGDITGTVGSRQTTLGDVTGVVGNGKITLSDVEGSYDLYIGNGDINITDATGTFRLTTGNGDIRLKEAKGCILLNVDNGSASFGGELNPGSDNMISVGNGPVKVEIIGLLNILLDLEIEDKGEIKVDLPVTVSEQSEHQLICTAGEGETTLNVRTGSGNITIK